MIDGFKSRYVHGHWTHRDAREQSAISNSVTIGFVFRTSVDGAANAVCGESYGNLFFNTSAPAKLEYNRPWDGSKFLILMYAVIKS